MRTHSPAPPSVNAFTAAVQAAAARVPGIVHAEGRHTRRSYSVRYTFGGMLIELEATPTADAAVARFIEAATADAQRGQLSPTTDRPSDTAELLTDEYMAPLGRWAKELAPLAPAHCEVFALADYRSEKESNSPAPRLAVCEPVTREQWGHLERGAIILYTETYRDETPADPLRALTTNVGRFIKYDARRAAFYATKWNEDEQDFDADADDVQEVYRVIQFLNVTPQPTARA